MVSVSPFKYSVLVYELQKQVDHSDQMIEDICGTGTGRDPGDVHGDSSRIIPSIS